MKKLLDSSKPVQFYGTLAGGAVLVAAMVFALYLLVFSSSAKIQKAYGAIPEKASFALYFKDFNGFSKSVLKSPWLKEIKASNLFKDFRRTLSASVDLFFFQADFNLEDFLPLVTRDLVVGKSEGAFFICAALSPGVRVLESFLRILPDDQVQEKNFEGQKYQLLTRQKKTFAFTFLGNYLLLSSSEKTFQSMVQASKNKSGLISEEEDQAQPSDAVFIKGKIPALLKNLNLLPPADLFSVTLSPASGKLTFFAPGNKDSEGISAHDADWLSFLEYYLPFYYENPFFQADKMLKTLETRPESKGYFEQFKKTTGFSLGEFFSEFSQGFSLAVLGFGPEPQTAFFFRLKDNSSSRDQWSKKIKAFLAFFFGSGPWKTESNTARGYESYYSDQNEVAFTLSKNLAALTFSKKSRESLTGYLGSPKPSLKDRLGKVTGASGKTMVKVFFDPASLIKQIEPIFRDYTLLSLKMDGEQYRDGFDKVLQALKGLKAIYLPIFHESQSNVYRGEAVFTQ